MRFIKFTFISVFLMSMVAGALSTLLLEDSPIVLKAQPLNAEQIKRVKAFARNNNPTKFSHNEKRTTSITEKDLNLFISHGLARFDDRFRARIRLFKNAAYITSSIKLPSNPVGNFINIDTEITAISNKIKIKSLRIGELYIPEFIVETLYRFADKKMASEFSEYKQAMNAISKFNIDKRHASVSYSWDSKLSNQIASSIISAPLLKRITAYTRHIANINNFISGPKPSLTQLLNPMFKYAVERSKTNNPVEENRALFITLGAYVLGKNIPRLLGNKSIGHLNQRNYYLHNRSDLTKHLLVSSALTAVANPKIAQLIGLEKEIDDSNGGSGFSFADLAADHAGVSISNMGLSSKKMATLLQSRMSVARNESDFMPSINKLSEGLQSIDFIRQYKNINNSRYKNVVNIIDQRIAQCALYKI